MIFEGIMLKCSLHIQAERTSSAIYHLLKGKKSIQTVQDAHIYQLEKFYGVYKSLTKETFDQKIAELLADNLLQEDTSKANVFKPSASAREWLNSNKKNLPFVYFNGLEYAEVGGIFFDRLMLLIQTVTNSKKKHYTFIPVVDKTAIENWVKIIYRKAKGSEHELLTAMYKELNGLLKHFSEREASMFVDRLTGYKCYGMSMEQLAIKYNMNKHDIQLLFSGMLQSMLSIIHKDKDTFLFLAFFLKDISSTLLITNSAYKTFELLKKQYTVDQIAERRQLKKNTIYDHIIEIALYEKGFPLQDYVTIDKQREITSAINKTKSYKLKNIKQSISEDISYFQIRLVLALEKNYSN